MFKFSLYLFLDFRFKILLLPLSELFELSLFCDFNGPLLATLYLEILFTYRFIGACFIRFILFYVMNERLVVYENAALSSNISLPHFLAAIF
jgi:hypothetical protein